VLPSGPLPTRPGTTGCEPELFAAFTAVPMADSPGRQLLPGAAPGQWWWREPAGAKFSWVGVALLALRSWLAGTLPATKDSDTVSK
jgi:hypothetical protein